MQRVAAILAALAALVAAGLQGVAAGLGHKFVQLRSEDFERRTQAASGQTSGRWMVLFRLMANEVCEARKDLQRLHTCRGGEQLNSAFDTLAIEDGLDYVVAEHVITDEGDTSALGWQRFGLNLTSVPTIFLFRDGGMYHWDITDMGLHTLLHEELVAVIRSFGHEGYKELPKLQVPPDIFAGAPPFSEYLVYLRKIRRLVAEVLEDKMGDSDPKYLIACGLAILVVGNILNRTAKKAAKKQKAAARKKD